MSVPLNQRTQFFVFIAIGSIIGFFLATIAWIGWNIDHLKPETILPIIVIGGVFVLLTTLGLLAAGFATLQLANEKQPLALPEGSIRAVIALMLVVLFTIISIFLYISLSNGTKIQTLDIASNLTDQQRAEFVSRSTVNIILIQPIERPGEAPRYTVYYQNRSGVADDFAKQLLILLGTLVTAVASFYFGATVATPTTRPTGQGEGATRTPTGQGAGATTTPTGQREGATTTPTGQAAGATTTPSGQAAGATTTSTNQGEEEPI
jgi:hypothetical protein